jgi:hypothetical protein
MILTTEAKEDLNIYNQLNEYRDTADSLTTRVEESDSISEKQKRDIFYPMIDEIKEMSENLIEKYVIYLKDKNNLELLDELREGVDMIIEKIDIFKNKIYEVYRLKEKTL